MSLEIFGTLGLELEQHGTQLVGDCPFCGKHNKFYLDPKSTKWDCKVCHESGNDVTIMSRMHEKVWRPDLNDRHVAKLAEYRRGLPDDAFWLSPNLGYDSIADQYTWLVQKPTGMPMGVRTFKLPKSGKKNAVHQLKGTPLGLLGAEAMGDKGRIQEPIYICEGEWDHHAWIWLLSVTKRKGTVLALPGAGNFSQDWAGWFSGRDVIGCYDNDDPGRKGTVVCWKRIKDVAKSLKFLHWDEALKDGYDIHDLVLEHVRKPAKALQYVDGHLEGQPTGEMPQNATTQAQQQVNAKQQEQEALAPISVEELHKVYRRWLQLENTDLLDVTMGTLWSVHLSGNPLWMFIVSPPSSSKSETLVPVGEWWRCRTLSTVTARGLISGMQGPGGVDPSLFAQLDTQRAGLIVKDLTPLLQTHREERDEVFGILRDAYDGSCSRMFGNGIRREYKELNFCVLAGVTPAIDSMSTVAMGERFLKFRPDREMDRADEEARAVRAISNAMSLDQMRKELKDAAVRCLQRPFDPADVLPPEGEIIELVARLARLVAWARGAVVSDPRTDRMYSRPVVEASPRLALQFVKLAQGLALHFEAEALSDPRVVGLLRRVALHTGDAISMSVIQVLYKVGKRSKRELYDSLPSLNMTTIDVTLNTLVATRLVVREMDGDKPQYTLSREAAQLLKDTGILDNLPTTDPFFRKFS